MEAPLHVVLGAGQVGALLADRLRARGHRVRVVRRTPGPGVVAGDLRDRSFAERALAGASVVHHCAHVPYEQWATVSLPLQRSIVAASGDARLVVLDNLYMYGRSDGPLREDTPVRPCSKKGSLRAQLAEELLSCGRSVAIARASDFLGPSLTGSFLGAPFWSKVKAGKPVDVLGDPDLPHAFTYTPDVAEALALLGEHDDEGVFHVPSIDTTLRAVVDAYARSLGVTIALRRVPAWVLAAASPFSPLLREVREMAYLWREPLRVDASKLTARFGLRATSLERAVATSLAAA